MSTLQNCTRAFSRRQHLIRLHGKRHWVQLAFYDGIIPYQVVPRSCAQGRQLRRLSKNNTSLSTVAPGLRLSPYTQHNTTTTTARYFSSKVKIVYRDNLETADVTKPIHQYIRTCLPNDVIFDEDDKDEDNNDKEAKSIEREEKIARVDSGFAISFLGTGGGGINSKYRIGSATALRLGGTTFLFDACEGTQRQISFSRIAMKDITKIFVTHLHGDHVYGLPGLLLSLQIAAKCSLEGDGGKSLKKKPTISVYGPPGLYNFLAMTLTLSCSSINFVNVIVYELVGGRQEQGPWKKTRIHRERKGGAGRNYNNADRRNIFLETYPEINHANLTRRSIPKNKDGTWTIEEPDDMAELLKGGIKDVALPNEQNAGRLRKFRISAAEVLHQPGVQTFGYAVEEPTPPRNMDAAKATELGVRPGPKYKLLKNGFPVMSDDGSREVKPEEVLAGAIRPRKFAIIGDNSKISYAMAMLCQNADVLVHEATLVGKDAEEKAYTRGHSSAATAGIVAFKANAKSLILNHLSPRLTSEDADDIIQNAEKTNLGVSQIATAYDFMEVWVPRGGFDFRSD